MIIPIETSSQTTSGEHAFQHSGDRSSSHSQVACGLSASSLAGTIDIITGHTDGPSSADRYFWISVNEEAHSCCTTRGGWQRIHDTSTYSHIPTLYIKETPHGWPAPNETLQPFSRHNYYWHLPNAWRGGELHKFDGNAASYTYAGTKIGHIHSCIPHVILQCGGNDAEVERADPVMRNYEQLLNNVRNRYPDASIVVCTVPPRGETQYV